MLHVNLWPSVTDLTSLPCQLSLAILPGVGAVSNMEHHAVVEARSAESLTLYFSSTESADI